MISLPAAKAHLRVEIDDEDDLIESLVAAATRYLERGTGWYLREPAETTWHVVGDGSRVLWLPQVVEEVDEVVGAGDPEPQYELRGMKLVRTDGRGWGWGTEYAVTAEAGFAVDEGPADLVQATKMLVAGWYEDREAYAAGRTASAAELPHTVTALVAAYQRVRT